MLSCDRICGPTCCGKALNLIFPKLSSQNMQASSHAMILIPRFHTYASDTNNIHDNQFAWQGIYTLKIKAAPYPSGFVQQNGEEVLQNNKML